MQKRMIIDAHAHIFPQKIASKASQNIAGFYGIPAPSSSGTVDQLCDFYGYLGISKAVVHSTATKKEQVCAINDFIYGTIADNDSLIGFATLHPELNEFELALEVERIKKKGLKGIKLHPDFQLFNLDNKQAQAIYRALNNEFPILLHIGDDRYDYSHPKRLVKMAEQFPNTTFIAAHFGGYQHWKDSGMFKDLPNVFFDTCSTLPFISVSEAMDIIENLGEDRFMFGTDFPLWNPIEEMDRFMKLPLSEEQRDKIFYKNAQAILKI